MYMYINLYVSIYIQIYKSMKYAPWGRGVKSLINTFLGNTLKKGGGDLDSM